MDSTCYNRYKFKGNTNGNRELAWNFCLCSWQKYLMRLFNFCLKCTTIFFSFILSCWCIVGKPVMILWLFFFTYTSGFAWLSSSLYAAVGNLYSEFPDDQISLPSRLHWFCWICGRSTVQLVIGGWNSPRFWICVNPWKHFHAQPSSPSPTRTHAHTPARIPYIWLDQAGN